MFLQSYIKMPWYTSLWTTTLCTVAYGVNVREVGEFMKGAIGVELSG